MELEQILKNYEHDMISTLQKWVSVPSVRGESEPDAPYGAEVRRMLDMAIKDCQDLGFETKTVGGYAGHAEMGQGEEKDTLGILAHLDVVPVGDGWDRDPFGGQILNNRIYGRGTSDDKGPAVAMLYAMKAIKDAGIPLKRKVRLVLGCSEESGGGEDMLRYSECVPMPHTGFSPDAVYPVINIEKGRAHLRIEGKCATDGLQVVSIHAGTRVNVIPGYAEAIVYGDASLVETVRLLDLGFETGADQKEGGLVKIWTRGKLGHAAMPDSAANAIGQLLILLRFLGVKGTLAHLADRIGTDYDGHGLGIASEDALSGKLTACLTILNCENGIVSGVMDIRSPLTVGSENIAWLAQMSLPEEEVMCESSNRGHYVSDDCELVKSLLKAYEKVTGKKGRTYAIGGGTYASLLEEGVAFGATFEDEPDMAHQANEYMNIDSLYKNMRIFAAAILELAAESK